MKKRIIILGLCILGIIAYHIIYVRTGIGIPCPIHELTGIFCPSCGSTRMIFSILELKLVKAFWYNPYLFVLIILFIIYLILKIVFKLKISINNKYFYILFIISLIGWTIIRNIPYFDFFRPY